MSSVEWSHLFTPQMNLFEIFVRGSVVYLAIFFLMRFVLKRQAGGVGITDLLFVVLVADAAQNAMAGEYNNIIDGLILVSVLLFWDYLLDWIAFRIPELRPYIQPRALLLIHNGKLMRRNLRSEMVTVEEMMGHIRLEGFEKLEDVKLAYMENDGQISVIGRKK